MERRDKISVTVEELRVLISGFPGELAVLCIEDEKERLPFCSCVKFDSKHSWDAGGAGDTPL